MQTASPTPGGPGAVQEGRTQQVAGFPQAIGKGDDMGKLKGEDYNLDDRPTAKRIRRLVELQGFRCAMTGMKLTPKDANLDHAVPIAAGGTHVMGNVQVVHKVINQMKSTIPKGTV